MAEEIRTAVVVVHGMGEQRPLETLNRFVRTALAPLGGKRIYYSRPARLTGSYEARRHLAIRRGPRDSPAQGQTEIFEYHWSYLLTGNILGDLLPTTARLLLRPPWRVPAALRGLWTIVWLLLVALVVGLVLLNISGVVVSEFTVGGVVAAVVANTAVLAVVTAVLGWLSAAITSSFVDVVRYLDTSPRSYEARRAIRGGMVDLLRSLQNEGRYSRVVVVAHSLGAYIAHDALASLWAETHRLHAGPASTYGTVRSLDGLPILQQAADAVLAHEAADEVEVAAFQDAQFVLWQGLRRQGNPWLVTDLVTVGTPMYFADLLYTRNRAEFDELLRRAELPCCPPQSEAQTVEGPEPKRTVYGWDNGARQVLGSGSPFAVVRWTNLWFPTSWGLFGDWFGGPLRPLFGRGIRDVAVTGNRPGRLAPGLAHGRYFSYPAADGPDDIATQVRAALMLNLHAELVALRSAPPADPVTARL